MRAVIISALLVLAPGAWADNSSNQVTGKRYTPEQIANIAYRQCRYVYQHDVDKLRECVEIKRHRLLGKYGYLTKDETQREEKENPEN